MYKFGEQIYLDEDKCVGCNKCLSNCPISGANIAYIVNGENKIKVNSEKCIHCGKCVKICEHNARKYIDDTEIFFQDLANGKKISVIASSAIRVNFAEYKKLLGYLKQLGVNVIYDEGFGGDITTWAYIKIIKKDKSDSLISGQCTPIVNYIEKYKPELIDKLSPVHSPMMSTAIYMKKYANIYDDIAFLSPCMAKRDEINDKNTYGYVKYNVTFKKLTQYLTSNNINLSQYAECDFDDLGCSLGFLYTRSGGMKENIELYMQDIWIRQMSGVKFSCNYIDDYANNIKCAKQIPLGVDINTCPFGCNVGTGTCYDCGSSAKIDEFDYNFNKLKKTKLEESDIKLNQKKVDWIHSYFDENLNLEDFKRVYNKNTIINDIIEPSNEQYDKIFAKMNKITKKSRNINCSACGYGSCKTMARCIFNELNVFSNCIDYNKKEVINEHFLLEARSQFFTNISHELRTPLNVIYSVLQLESTYIDSFTATDIEKYNKIIKQNCLRLIRLANNVIDISRIEAGFLKPLFKIENVVSEVENITLSIATYVKNKKMNLIFDTDMEELYINCDTNLIERIMLNLLSNSVKYGKENGTIKVYIYEFDSNNVAISVKDDGIGIPEKMQKKIFERFQKVDTSLSRKNEGSGIGLSLVKALVEIQNGTISCRSELDKGSEFIVIFPIDTKEHKVCAELRKHKLYEKNITESVDIEFSDIYI